MRYRGQNLVEIAVIMGVIGVISVAALSFLGINVNNMFQISANKFADFKPFDSKAAESNTTTANTTTNNVGGSLGGSPTNPVEQCEGNQCKIDFGEFMLSDIPQDYNELVLTSGTSGATQTMLGMIDQIVNQLEGTVPENELLEIKKLSIMGHNIALIENKLENIIQTCNFDNDCIKNQDSEVFTKPAGYDDRYGTFTDGMNTYAAYHASELGFAYNAYLNNNDIDGNWPYFKETPNYDFVVQYDKIINSPNYSTTTKDVVRQLVDTMMETGQGFHDLYESCTPGDIKDYNASTVTHLDSKIICGVSLNTDTGERCQ